MAEWQELDLDYIEEAVGLSEGVSTLVGNLAQVIGTGVDILEFLSTFLSSPDHPLLEGTEVLLSEIQTILDNISESSVHTLSMIPMSLDEMVLYQGGYGRFEQLFLQSIHDTEDPNRPQFNSNTTVGALFLMLTEESPADFIQKTFRLFSYFDRPFDLRYPAPVNVTAKPAGQLGLPENQLLNVFTDKGLELDRLRLEWEEPRIANDILLDIFAENKFYLERSKSRQGFIELVEVPISRRQSPQERRLSGENQTKYVPAFDAFGDPITHWEPVNPDDPFIDVADTLDIANNRINFLAGTYAHVLEDIEKGSENGYYYRIRSVPKLSGLTSSNKTVRNAQGDVVEKEIYELILGNEFIDPLCQPSIPTFGYLPDIDPSFDLPTALLKTYRAAYLLRFDDHFNSPTGNSILGTDMISPSVSSSLYDQIESTEYEFIVINEDGDEETDRILYFEDPLFSKNELKRNPEAMDYDQMRNDRSAALVIDAGTFDPFGGVDEFIAPRLDLPDNVRLKFAIDKIIDTKIKALVPYLTSNDDLFRAFQTSYQSVEGGINSLLTQGFGLADLVGGSNIRLDVYELLQLIEGGDTQGTPPNWESTQIVNDYFPFVNQLTNQLSDLIFSLSNVLQSTLDEFDATLSSIEDRLESLNSILDLIAEIISILDAFSELATTFRLLWVDPEGGGNQHLVSEFRSAENTPDRTSDAFLGALVFVFGGPGPEDIAGIQNAFQFLFGV